MKSNFCQAIEFMMLCPEKSSICKLRLTESYLKLTIGYYRCKVSVKIFSFLLQVLDEKILNPRHQIGIMELERARVTLSSLVLLINKEKKARKIVSNLQDQDMDRYATIKTLK